MRHAAIVFGVAFAAIISSASAETDLEKVTPEDVNKLAEHADKLLVAGDLEGFKKILAEDLVVSYEMFPDTDAEPTEYDRSEYLETLRSTYHHWKCRRSSTSIDEIEISADGQQAVAEDTVIQELVDRRAGLVLKMVAAEKVVLRIVEGKLQISEIEATVEERSIEPAKSGIDG